MYILLLLFYNKYGVWFDNKQTLEILRKNSNEYTTFKYQVIPEEKVNFLNDIESCFNDDQISFSDEERVLHSHGQNSPDEVFKVLYDKLEKFTDIIVYV